jgi:hypothetical protein
VHRFAEQGIDTYEPLHFSRDATLPDGRTMRVAFSLAFATEARLPELAFFTCQHHQPHHLLWQPDYRRHANGAGRVVEVILSADDPAHHRGFFERLAESDSAEASGLLSVGPPDNRLTLLSRKRLAERFPECTANAEEGRFAACRITVADLGTVERHLRDGGIRHRSGDGAVVVAPSEAFGLVIEFCGSPG